MSEPTFLLSLDRVTATDDGWVAQCPVFGCPELLEITETQLGYWRFACDGQHTHDDVADYLDLDTLDLQLPHVRNAGIRAWEALMLARTPEAWSQLLLGQPVPADQLDPEFLARMRSRHAA